MQIRLIMSELLQQYRWTRAARLSSGLSEYPDSGTERTGFPFICIAYRHYTPFLIRWFNSF